MSSYLKLYQEFLQKNENTSRDTLSDDDLEEDESSSKQRSKKETNKNKARVCLSESDGRMEHSYTRDCHRPSGEITGLTTRTIIIRRPPQCPSCHTHPLEESDLDDPNQPPIPTYNEIAAREAMNECHRIAKSVKNLNSDNEDWEATVNQIGWNNVQKQLFGQAVQILDLDQLGRLSNTGRQNEAMQRRVLIDKSSKRFRKALASVSWDARLTQWIHGLFMDCLPSSYMASYLDILQTLKSKLPTLMDKMLFGRPMNFSQDLLAPVLKKKWEPVVTPKHRKLTQNAIIIALPSMPTNGPVPNRIQKWYQHLATITQIVQVSLPMGGSSLARQPLEQVAEQIISLTRIKIQELRNEQPSRSIILVGFNAGAALALQVVMSETVNCVICMGFAFNTLHGIRGTPDDRILDVKVPILFVIGQNSARTSQEEIESLREKMQSETSLVIVGSADDVLRVPKNRRKIENITQSMVDVMVIDEVYEFIKKMLTNPPGPRIPTSLPNSTVNNAGYSRKSASGTETQGNRKRKQINHQDGQTPAKVKNSGAARTPTSHIGRPRTRPYPLTPTVAASSTSSILTSTPIAAKQLSANQQMQTSDLNLAIQSILGESPDNSLSQTDSHGENNSSVSEIKKIVTNYEIVAQSKSTPIKTILLNSGIKSTHIGGVGATVNTPTLPTLAGQRTVASISQNANTAVGTKIKMIPSNQFVQLKPPIQSQSKIYTIKTTSMPNNVTTKGNVGSNGTAGLSVATTSGGVAAQNQIFTLKTGGTTTQFITASPPVQAITTGSVGGFQQKYTVVKAGAPITGSTLASGVSGTNSSDDLSNIFDMPIIFADNDGNLTESVNLASTPSMPNVSPAQLIISPNLVKEETSLAASTPNSSTLSAGVTTKGTYVINSSILQQQQKKSKPNKVVFINRNTMKPCPNIISRSNVAQQLPKYAKVVVTNPKTSAPTFVARAPGGAQGNVRATNGSTGTINQASTITPSVKQFSIQNLKSPVVSGFSTSAEQSGILNVGNVVGAGLKPVQQFQIINMDNSDKKSFVKGGVVTQTATSTTPLDKQQQHQTQLKNTIVLKPGGLKQIPAHLKSQLLNRNLTVRKLVNLVPAAKTSGVITTTVSQLQAGTVQQKSLIESTSSVGTSGGVGAQTLKTSATDSPRIITLNPVTPKQQSKAE